MIELGLPFQNGMILQRGKSFAMWGKSDKKQSVSVYLNNSKIAECSIPKGDFKVILPPQEAMENSSLQIGDVVLTNVDFGEVWLAGGQSNMQFYVKWDAERELVYRRSDDSHFRYFEVAKYTFEGEEKDGFKDESHWNKWLPFNRKNSPWFSSVAAFFALEIRKKLGVPVGIVSCSFGGTSASAWIKEELLRDDEELKIYTDEYDKSIEELDLARYRRMSRLMRKNMSVGNEETEDFMHRNVGVTVEQFYRFMMERGMFGREGEESEFSAEEMSCPGPNDPHPGSLYRMMLKKVIGYTVKGVIWYQGCSDEQKAALYPKLFTTLIKSWRADWREELPFIFAQLAPFGSWFGNEGNNFPDVRKAQEEVEKSLKNVYMVSTSDVGCEKDIHPKYKRQIGVRMAFQAFDKIYGIETAADSPRYSGCELYEGTLSLYFLHGDGLHVEGKTVESLKIVCDGNAVETYCFETNENVLKISSPRLAGAKCIAVRFAQTPYYEVNLYNGANLPAFPFKTEIKGLQE